jgi:hypothetical protein
VANGAKRVKVNNNIFAGLGAVLVGPGECSHNLQAHDPGFVNRAKYDYHLRDGSLPIDAGVPPGTANGFELAPTAEYIQPVSERPRVQVGKLDVGAHEFHPQIAARP